MFDWEEMAKSSLATHWRKRTDEEREEFVSLFSSLMNDPKNRNLKGRNR